MPTSKEVGIGSSVIFFHLARVLTGGKAKQGLTVRFLFLQPAVGIEKQGLELSKISWSCGIQVQGTSSSSSWEPGGWEGALIFVFQAPTLPRPIRGRSQGYSSHSGVCNLPRSGVPFQSQDLYTKKEAVSYQTVTESERALTLSRFKSSETTTYGLIVLNFLDQGHSATRFTGNFVKRDLTKNCGGGGRMILYGGEIV